MRKYPEGTNAEILYVVNTQTQWHEIATSLFRKGHGLCESYQTPGTRGAGSSTNANYVRYRPNGSTIRGVSLAAPNPVNYARGMSFNAIIYDLYVVGPLSQKLWDEFAIQLKPDGTIYGVTRDMLAEEIEQIVPTLPLRKRHEAGDYE